MTADLHLHSSHSLQKSKSHISIIIIQPSIKDIAQARLDTKLPVLTQKAYYSIPITTHGGHLEADGGANICSAVAGPSPWRCLFMVHGVVRRGCSHYMLQLAYI
jgi:hypothetical protein